MSAKSAAGIVLTEAGLGGIVRRCKGGQDHVSAHSYLHAELRPQEDRAGAVVGDWPRHDRTCGFDSHVDGHCDDHRRLPGHVFDHGQSASIADAELLASRKIRWQGRFWAVAFWRFV